jgi:hypothetical protein
VEKLRTRFLNIDRRFRPLKRIDRRRKVGRRRRKGVIRRLKRRRANGDDLKKAMTKSNNRGTQTYKYLKRVRVRWLILFSPDLSKPKMSTFRFQARYALLTYAQSNGLNPNRIVERIGGYGGECIVGEENHSDGHIHYHVFCDFGNKFRSRHCDVFDVDGFHPNIQTTKRSPKAGWDYATKDGNIVAGGLAEPMETTIERDDDKWSTLCDITDEAVFWDSCKNLVPKNLITNFISLQKYANWKFNKPCVEYKTPSTVRFNNESIHELDDWATANVRNTVTGTYSCKAWRAPGAENRD